MDPFTMLAHDEFEDVSGPVVPPIFQTSNFRFGSFAEMEAVSRGELVKPIYSRGNNPTVQSFESKVAALEGGEAARATASGMAAISLAVLSQLRAGDRVVAVRDVYPDAFKLLAVFLPRFGVRVDFVDGADTGAFVAALVGARIAYLESPTSLSFRVQDLTAIAKAARDENVTTIIDNSWATPLHQRPLSHGIDLVVHSASKYLGGHSDVVAGVIVGSADRIRAINSVEYTTLGPKLSPLEGFLLLRGLRTLPLRLTRQAASALTVARWLKEQALVEEVNHPALAAGDQGEIYSRHFLGGASLFSFRLAGGRENVRAFVDALRLFRPGVSWGGHESLVYPAAIGASLPTEPNPIRSFGLSPQLVRLHVGLEDPRDLIADLGGALEAAARLR